MGSKKGLAGIVRRWIVNLVLLLVACLLGMSICFGWRLGMIAYRIEEAVLAVSDDIKEVTATAAQISRDVSEIREELKEVKAKVEESMPLDELDNLMDATMEIGRSFSADSVSLDAEAEREIKRLLRASCSRACNTAIAARSGR